MIGFALAALGLVGSASADSAPGAVAFLSLAVFGADMTLPPSWSLCIDVGRRHAGAVSGTMNMAGNLGSFVTGLAFPYLHLWTGSTTPFFLARSGAERARRRGVGLHPSRHSHRGFLMRMLKGVAIGAGYFSQFQYRRMDAHP